MITKAKHTQREAVAEIRSRQRLTGRQARRELERRLPDPSLMPGG